LSPELLADENIDAGIIRALRVAGFSVIAIRELQPGAKDREILEIAKQNGSILITEDKDFGELIFSHKAAETGVIFLRYHVSERESICESLIQIIKKNGFNLRNRFTVITTKKVRMRDF